MSESDRSDFTKILLQMNDEGADKPEITHKLLEAMYPDLRILAQNLMRRERRGHTLQPTALVHEAYVKLVDDARVEWQDRAQFMGIAARAMRQLLVDHARRHSAAKRGGGLQRVTLDDSFGNDMAQEFEIMALHDALRKFAQMDERAAKVVELKVFGGLKIQEIAHVLDVSKRTVDGDWAMARMWLGRELREQ
ncbi:MAG: DNA-directed RNA polymerase sigma-70 factor [Gemmatimonadota bacterium]|nr:MAG: DNA-directed RNA polymerase sigma-70 factor [Gemmatimonadota bacterium]